MNIDLLIKEATLSKDKVALNAYKNLKTEIQKTITAKNAPKPSEELYLKICSKYCSNLENAIKQFSEAHRDDLVSEYTSELEVLKKLLPEPVNASDIYYELEHWAIENNYLEREIAKIIEIPKKEMGTVIKYLKAKFPTAEGKLISNIVKEYIA